MKKLFILLFMFAVAISYAQTDLRDSDSSSTLQDIVKLDKEVEEATIFAELQNKTKGEVADFTGETVILSDPAVTFNVDMTDAVAEGDIVFDPAVHDVFITGTFTGWVEPGSDETFKLTPANDKAGVYTITLNIEEIDTTHYYKYFLIEDSPAWNMGEWPGDPNREIFVDGSMTVNDVFGSYYPYLDPGAADFDIRNPADVETVINWGEATSIVEITLDGDPVSEDDYTITEINDEKSIEVVFSKGVNNLNPSLTVFDKSLFEGAAHEDQFVFTFEFDFGDDVTFTVNIIDSEVGIFEAEDFTLSLYPNPASDRFTLESNKIINHVKLISINGQIVKDIVVNSLRTEVETSNLYPGVYFIQIHAEGKIFTERVQIIR